MPLGFGRVVTKGTDLLRLGFGAHGLVHFVGTNDKENHFNHEHEGTGNDARNDLCGWWVG